jgi:hypothetical protein
MVADVDQRDVFTTPADNLALFEAGVRGLSAEQVSAATAKLFAGSGPLAYLNAPAPVEGGDSALAKAYADASKAEVRAGAVQEAKAWPYQNFGTPGTVAERHELAGLGATAIRFANGVRLTVKPTAFAKDEILVSVRIGSGQVGLPEDSAKSTWALPGAFALGGLGKISYEDLQQALASKVYAVNFAVGEDAFQLAGKTRPQDFATQLQLLAAYASDPGLRSDRLEPLPGGERHHPRPARQHPGRGGQPRPRRPDPRRGQALRDADPRGDGGEHDRGGQGRGRWAARHRPDRDRHRRRRRRRGGGTAGRGDVRRAAGTQGRRRCPPAPCAPPSRPRT